TRVIGDGLMPAGASPVDMPAERGRATASDRAQDGSLLDAEARMLLDEGGALRVEDVRDLHGRPGHGCAASFKSRCVVLSGPVGRWAGVAAQNWLFTD